MTSKPPTSTNASQSSHNDGSIPIVDIGARASSCLAHRKALADQLATILHTVGFVIVTNHGISTQLIESVFAQSSQFFDLPVEQRQKLDKRQSRHFRGWEPVGAESTNGLSDWREQIDLWTEYAEKAMAEEKPIYHNLLGPNQWPTKEMAPNFRPILEEWYQEMKALGDSLMGLFALGLGLEEDRFADLFGTDRMSLIKLINYPQTPAGSFGVHAHADTGFLTILAAGVTPGLQVQKISSKGEWMDVPIIPNSFVVNIGEALQHMTGNYFVATPHRVKATAARLSCGYFHGPSLDTPMATLTDLPTTIYQAVQASPYHRQAGFMKQQGTEKEDSQNYEEKNDSNDNKPETWGAMIWNYLSRSYPEIMQQYYK